MGAACGVGGYMGGNRFRFWRCVQSLPPPGVRSQRPVPAAHTRSISKAEDGTQEIHEDVGYVSHDADRDTFVFRQFLSEGYVNEYDLSVSADGSAIEFADRGVESGGGMRARIHLSLESRDVYEMVLDLADPGAEFVACQTMTLTRVN